MRLILSDCKSGRWIRCASDGQARRAALNLGWTDYEITEEKRHDECALDPFGQAAIERRRHDEACAADAELRAREAQTHRYLRPGTDPAAAGRRMGLDEYHHHRGD